jgi:hypothetical protein
MLRIPVLVALILMLAGCVSPRKDPRLRAIRMPSDFALELSVRGEPDSDDPTRQSVRYVVESNRRMRMLVGQRAQTRTFPRFLRDLTPTEFESLWDQIDQSNLLSEPTSPLAQARHDTAAGLPPHPEPPAPPEPPPSPTATAPAPPVPSPEEALLSVPMNPAVYEVAIRANGHTHRYATTPAESPPTVSLLLMLTNLRESSTPPILSPGTLGPEGLRR